jgi:pSer/pThr/pTyr-binding forkhead associated (FHA) protein
MTFSLDVEPGDEAPVPLPDPGSHGKLIVTRGPNSGSEFSLEHVITSVGRHPDSDIFLDDVTVSRRHVEVERTTSGTVVRDVGSLNGTYVNQQRIDGQQPLANGDEVQVGKFKLVYLAGEGS